MPEGNDLRPDLFKDVKFCIIEDGEILDKVKTVLLNGGGKHFNYLSDIVTHVIADNPDSPDVSEAQELFEKPVVTSRWVLLSAKCNSLLPINGFSPVKNQLFSGTVICPSQISTTDIKFLWAMATFYGGTFQIELNKSCTHLVAGKAEGAKYEQALKNPNIIKIVTPDWVLDSVKNKRLCDEDLYHPRLLILPEPEIPKIPTPSPLSSSVTSALISLNRMNLVESLSQTPIQLPPQLAPRTVKIPSLENRLLQDVAKTLNSTITIKTEPNTQQFTSPEQNVVSSKTPPFPVLPHQQMQQSPRQLPSPVSQHSFLQSQQHQILQQGDQKLSQALQHLQAQQQPQLQRPQQTQQSPQVLQQKMPWQQQRMTYVQQQQIQQQLLQMQRYRLMQQQLRNRQPLPSTQLSHLQQQTQPHLQQQQSSQSHLQQQPKQPQLHVQQLHLQPQPLHVQQQQQQHSLVQAPSQQPLISQQHMQQQPRPQSTVQPQLHLQAQPQIHQQPQPLSSQLQQQALQKQQIQQQHLQQLQQQQLLKQQHLQHLQQQQQAHLQQQTLAQPSHLQQTHIQQSSPHHLQQQTLMQPSPQQSPLQQSPLQQSPIQQSPQQNQLQQPALQQSQLQQTTIQQAQQPHLQQQTQPLLSQQSHIQQPQQQQSPLQQPHLPQPQQQQSPLQQPLHIQQPPPQALPKPSQQSLMQQQQSHVQQQPSPHLHQQLQQQPSPQPPQSPHLQQQPRFTHQLHQNLRPVQKQFQQVTFPPTQQPMHGQPPVQGLHQQQLLQQRQQQLQQQLALQQMRQRQLQQQQLQSSQQPTQAQSTQQVLAGQPPVMMKPPPQYPYDRQQLTGQPRLQYPPHPRQIPPQLQQQPPPPPPPQQQQQHQRLPWQQFPQQQQQQIIQRPPGTPQPQSPQWQQLQQASPKDELSPSPQSLQQQQILWQQRQQQQQQQQQLQQDQQRDNPTPAPQQIVWQQQQQQQQPSQPRENTQPLQPSQLLQWQQLKQIELRRQQLLQQQQQQQQQFQSQRQASLVQFSPQSDLPQNVARVTVPPQHQQPLAVPAQYQPQNPSTVLSQQTPPNISQVVQPPTQVTPKTKTALANLLNTRLQGTGRMMEVDCNQPVVRSNQVIAVPPEGEAPTHFQHPVQTSTVPRRSSAENMTLIHSVVPHSVVQERNNITPVPQVHFYGHDPRIHVPSDLSLLGCVFCIQDYDTNVDTERLTMWKKVINQHGGEVESGFNSRCTHVLCESQRNSIVQQAMREGKRCITAFWLNDVLQQKKMKPPWLALHLPSPFLDDKPCKNQIITVTNFEGDERMWLKRMVHSVGAKYTGYMTQHNTLIICKRKDGTKAVKAREWKIPAVNVQWLHDVMFGHYDALRLPMAHKYQQYDMEDHFKIDYALVPHLMAAWKAPIKINEEMWKKFLPLNNSNLNKDDKKRKREETEEGHEAKQPRSESPPLEENIPLTTQNPPTEESKPHVMFTGLKHLKAYSKIVYQLGGCLSRSSKECTHLVATHFVRTVKFLCAIHTVKYVIIPEWLTESEKQNKFIDEQQYILHDPEGEKQFGFSLRETLSRTDKTPIFKGFVFFVTPGVYPPPAVLKDVVENGGGTAVFKKRPTYRQITAMAQAGTQFVVITCENDLHLCKDFLQKKINVQNAEFLLTGSLRQQLDFQSFAFT